MSTAIRVQVGKRKRIGEKDTRKSEGGYLLRKQTEQSLGNNTRQKKTAKADQIRSRVQCESRAIV